MTEFMCITSKKNSRCSKHGNILPKIPKYNLHAGLFLTEQYSNFIYIFVRIFRKVFILRETGLSHAETLNVAQNDRIQCVGADLSQKISVNIAFIRTLPQTVKGVLA